MPAKKAAARTPAAKKAAAPSKKTSSRAATTTKTATKAAAKTSKKPAAKKPAPEMTNGLRLALAAARLAEDIKAEDIVVLDVSAVSTITDFFVICSGSSAPHLKAIAREVRAGMAENQGVKPATAEGDHESQWVVLDYGILMVHAFHPEKRTLYALEDLWGDATRIDWEV
jgi:ribosome-associated protein